MKHTSLVLSLVITVSGLHGLNPAFGAHFNQEEAAVRAEVTEMVNQDMLSKASEWRTLAYSRLRLLGKQPTPQTINEVLRGQAQLAINEGVERKMKKLREKYIAEIMPDIENSMRDFRS